MIVVIEKIRAAQIGNVKIHIAIIIVVGGGYTLGEGRAVDVGLD